MPAALEIVLLANYQFDPHESMRRYADLLLSELRRRGYRTTVIQPKPRFGRINPRPTGFGKWLGYLDKFILFPPEFRARLRELPAATVVHLCDNGDALQLRQLGQVPHVATCHDVFAIRAARGEIPDHQLSRSGRLYQRLNLASLRTAHRIACDSRETRRQLLALGGFAPDRVTCISIALNYPYGRADRPRSASTLARLAETGISSLPDHGYIFHIGGNQGYKNRAGVLRIYFEYVRAGGTLPLVMAGRPFNSELNALLRTRPQAASVLELGPVTNEELNTLYSRASCLLFPSLHEGFGWPIAEAFACGCRVITSNREPMSEVGGDAAVYIDPENEAAAAQTRAQVTAAPPSADEIAALVSEAARFEPARMVDAFLQLYQAELASARPLIPTVI